MLSMQHLTVNAVSRMTGCTAWSRTSSTAISIPRGITFRGHFPELFYSRGLTQLFSIDTGTGLLRPTFDGWNLIPEGYRVYIDDFIPEGDVLVPGVTHADPGIRDGDEVLVVGAACHRYRAGCPAGGGDGPIAPRGSSAGA